MNQDGLNRRRFLAYSAAGAAATTSTGLVHAAWRPNHDHKEHPVSRPACLFFDVNETLLDLTAMKASVAEALGGRPDLLSLWFTTMLQYSLVSSAGGQYEDFGVIGAAAMRMVARNNGIELTEAASKEAIRPILSLPPHPDVRDGLARLKAAGYRMVTLTNSSNKGVEAQMEHAGLTDMFEARLSVEDVQMYKPHQHVYAWASRKLGVDPGDCMLVAAHGWDIAGALWAGWRGAFLSRPGAQLYPLAPEPEINVPDLGQAADQLIALPS
ncbi:MAG: haloacid dehalogenase type II [Phycisphaerales bacterium JB047]